ncbi:MAG: Gfo/Idh/MocA family oxidoreductase [Candidatus Odinarchaeota archaeon]|nr:Gfo/Idh/MocA family oxidoreductase [Candidatus Odinarchaeota archaeon]
MIAKIAVIGTGAWGKNHARVFHEIQNAELVAVCDIDEEKAKRIAKMYNCKWYTDYRDLLRNENIDAVSIATPTTTHFEVAKYAIERGFHVLVEKPLAATVEEGIKLVDLAKDNSVLLMVGFITRFCVGVQKLKELIKKKEIGDPVLLNARRVGPFWPERVGDVGVVKDVAIHDIDSFRYLLDKDPIAVYATAGSLKHRYEDHTDIILHFDGDLNGFIEANWLTPNKKREISVTGSQAIVSVDLLTQDIIMETEEWVMKSKTPWVEPLKLELQHFAESVARKRVPIVTGEDGVKALIIAERVLESAKIRKPVDIVF